MSKTTKNQIKKILKAVELRGYSQGDLGDYRDDGISVEEASAKINKMLIESTPHGNIMNESETREYIKVLLEASALEPMQLNRVVKDELNMFLEAGMNDGRS